MDYEDLVEQLREGHEYAGPFLVSLLGSRMLAYARAVAPDLSDTDRELVVELAIEKAVAKIEQFDPQKGTFPGWTRTFVRHELSNWRRTNMTMLNLDNPDAVATPPPNEPAADRDRVSEAMAPLVQQLSPTDQLIIHLRDYEQLPYEEIARRLDVREDACRQRHRRAIARLADHARRNQEVLQYVREGER